jgi:TolB-like protein
VKHRNLGSMRRPLDLLLAIVACLLLFVHAQRADAQRVLSQGVKDLAADILAKATKEQKHRVAVLPFREVNGRKTILDSYLSETLLTLLVAPGSLEVVERSMLDKVLAEIKLGQTGIIDSATARHLGKVAGADAIVTGTVTELRTSIVVNCRLFDAQTGLIFAAAQTTVIKDADVMTLLYQPEPGTAAVPERPLRDGAQAPGGGVTGGATAGGPGSGHFPTTAPLNPHLPLASERDHGFTFDVLECRGEGSVISCDLRFTNRMADRWIWLSSGYGSRTYLVDAQGNSCAASKSTWTWGVLPSQVPRRVTVDFSNCPRNTSELSYLELGFQLDNPALGSQFKVPFRHRFPVENK